MAHKGSKALKSHTRSRAAGCGVFSINQQIQSNIKSIRKIVVFQPWRVFATAGKCISGCQVLDLSPVKGRLMLDQSWWTSGDEKLVTSHRLPLYSRAKVFRSVLNMRSVRCYRGKARNRLASAIRSYLLPAPQGLWVYVSHIGWDSVSILSVYVADRNTLGSVDKFWGFFSCTVLCTHPSIFCKLNAGTRTIPHVQHSLK